MAKRPLGLESYGMSALFVFALFAVTLISLSVFYLFFYRNWRRQRELDQPFPTPWRALLHENVPLYQRLAPEQQKRLEQHVQLFLAEKEYYGCDGFEVDDRVRVTIAGHACLLILARPFSDYDEVRSILVYPDVYRVQASESDGLVVREDEQIRAGEASSRGQVVLAWSECEDDARHPDEPHNVVLHEFAHQLDYLDGTADGAPPLSGQQAEQWLHTMTEAYEHLRRSLRHHHQSWLDPYGATQPAEFFAVLTEAFYQQPAHLKDTQPAVYAVLCDFYRIDPMIAFCSKSD